MTTVRRSRTFKAIQKKEKAGTQKIQVRMATDLEIIWSRRYSNCSQSYSTSSFNLTFDVPYKESNGSTLVY